MSSFKSKQFNIAIKVAVISFSGNVGKTTVSDHFLSTRLNAPVIPVETINSNDSDAITLKGKDLDQIMEAVNILDTSIVDVGASNVEDFMMKMREYKGCQEDFDYFIVPVIPNKKQIKDTIATIKVLAEDFSVPSNKIILLFNMVENGTKLEMVFEPLFKFHKVEGLFTLSTDFVIHDNDVFRKIGKGKIRDIAEDETDFKALIKAETNGDEKIRLSQKLALRRLAIGITEDMDTLFSAMFE